MGIIIILFTILSLMYVISNIKSKKTNNKNTRNNRKLLISLAVFITCLLCTIYYFIPFNFKFDNSNFNVRVELYGEKEIALQENQVDDLIKILNELKVQRGFTLKPDTFASSSKECIVISLYSKEGANNYRVFLSTRYNKDSYIEKILGNQYI
ncbi:hypothetical protein [Lachnoclostridium sp.]|uniref:hypothetical protein n=1 Tax=Lachnoclostridium sp. TaxID=2028282 RepID=UPI002896C133|nr:hypothetical protein [Lachnoclostridium sp.]